jgi:protease I
VTLTGKNIAILVAPRGTEDAEFTRPKAAVMDAGASVTVISLEPGEAKTVNSDLDPGSTSAARAIKACRRPINPHC